MNFKYFHTDGNAVWKTIPFSHAQIKEFKCQTNWRFSSEEKKNAKRRLENNALKELRNPNLSPVIQSSLLQDSRLIYWNMSHQTTVFCKLLLPSYAIFCNCTIHGILKIGKKRAFLHIALTFTSVCDLISTLSSHPYLCTPSSARKFWTLNCLWNWWELRIPSTFQDGVRKVNKKLSPSKLFLQ